MRKPILCRLGWHTSTYRDSAMVNSADRCNWCGEYTDKMAGRLLDAEREMWDKKSNP